MNIIFIGITVIVLILVIVLISGLVFLIMKKSPKTNELHKRSNLFPGQVDDPSDSLTSNVRLEHVEGLIKRDFPVEKHPEVVEALSKYTKGYKATVYHIILQEAKGDIDKVKEYIKIADEVGDYRDLAQALISIKSK